MSRAAGYWFRGRLVIAATATLVAAACSLPPVAQDRVEDGDRQEVLFWHFWGGEDRPVVEGIVEQFNRSQTKYRVRAIAMPGNNLDLKFFLSVAGGDPPDLLNHDDPVVADWAHRGVVLPLDEVAAAEEIAGLEDWLYPAARELGSYEGRLYALCNGLDIRALYCNQTLLEEHGLPLPSKLADLDEIAATIAPPGQREYRRMGYLPDPRRLWAWGPVFGGQFVDRCEREIGRRVTADHPANVAALQWIGSYSERYGPSVAAAFRSGDQALTGAHFPMLADRRYAVLMDGQWRLRDIAAARRAAGERGGAIDRFTVVPLPPPPAGREEAGWVNGNFFVIPRHAAAKQGAWEFMKYWTGYGGHERQAAEACVRGGWIPASPRVVQQPPYQEAMQAEPMLRTFVRLAGSPHQRPTPALPVASYYYQQVNDAASRVMYRGDDPRQALEEVDRRVEARLREVLDGS